MAKTYHLTAQRRLVNWLMRALLRLGLTPPGTYLCTVPGHRTGRLRSTPVTLVDRNGCRWLVAPYGDVGWVHNARVAGRVGLSRGRRTETVRIEETGVDKAGPVLKTYATQVRVARPFFDAAPGDPAAAFAAEAARHPVFRLATRAGGPRV